MIKPYLRDMMNDHKTPTKIHSPNTVIDYETTFGEWKIQLKMRINSISSKNFEETCTIHSVSNNIEILMDSETADLIDELLNLFYKGIKKQKKN